MIPRSSPLLPIRRILLGIDAALVVGSLFLAIAERMFIDNYLPLRGLPTFRFHLPEYVLLAVLAVPLWLGLAWKLDLHSVFERAWTLPALAWRLTQHHILGFVAASAVVYTTQVVVNRSLALLFLANTFLTMFLLRGVLVLWRRNQYRRGTGPHRLLLVGNPAGPMKAFAKRLTGADFPPVVVGYLAPADARIAPPRAPDESERLGTIEQVDEVLEERPVDQVFFFPPFNRADRVEAALLSCEKRGIPAMFMIDMHAPTQATAELAFLADYAFVSFELAPKRVDLLAVKHTFDFFAAAVLFVLALPILVGAALAILLTDGRPVLFTQQRAGLRGRPFTMLKFRTMSKGADAHKESLLHRNEMSGPVFKMHDDPRVTRLGRWLRRTSIDELPQLLHVLSGRMSLVGPRPLPLAEQRAIRGWHRRRLAMRPGITGLWQVSGRSDLDFDKWMQLDLQYVNEWSPWLDARILAKTVPVVLSQRGAR